MREELAVLGPPASAGPLPALFYFALSAQDSLHLDPFNQPVAYLSALPLRIYSLTLPGHEDGLPATEALNVWAQEVSLIPQFVDKATRTIDRLVTEGLIRADKLAVAGLSRGGFIATHVAAKLPYIQTVLGFAPLTRLSLAKEFAAHKDAPHVQSLDLTHLAPHLIGRTVRYYIGNVDTRVSTRACFDCIDTFAHAQLAQQIRSPAVELIIYPSIGNQGHGTPKEIFHHGAQWVAEKLEVLDVL